LSDQLDRGPVDFHLVIPCFEESGRLPGYLNDLIAALRKQVYRTSILVVDDGSGPGEREKLKTIVSSAGDTHEVTVACLRLERNMGKGYAVRRGWEAGTAARWLAFADADGATPAYEVVRIFDAIHRSNDVGRCYLGSRVRMLGRSVERRWERHLIGRMYATLVGLAISESVYDSQCGFKIIPGEAFATIAGVLRENRFAFDSELITALSEAGYRLEEVPIDWKDIAGSKVSLIKDSARMVGSLVLIQNRKKAGSYRTHHGSHRGEGTEV
jgi:dolichyl-phosphate beta-glucosyltransferase